MSSFLFAISYDLLTTSRNLSYDLLVTSRIMSSFLFLSSSSIFINNYGLKRACFDCYYTFVGVLLIPGTSVLTSLLFLSFWLLQWATIIVPNNLAWAIALYQQCRLLPIISKLYYTSYSKTPTFIIKLNILKICLKIIKWDINNWKSIFCLLTKCTS